jgi:hypothetical protein
MRYILFLGDLYYPNGGAGDIFASSNDLNDLTTIPEHFEFDYDWWHIYDVEDQKVIAGSECHPTWNDDYTEPVKLSKEKVYRTPKNFINKVNSDEERKSIQSNS